MIHSNDPVRVSPLTYQGDVMQQWEEDAESFAHMMETDDPLRSRAESLLLTLLEVGQCTANILPNLSFGSNSMSWTWQQW